MPQGCRPAGAEIARRDPPDPSSPSVRSPVAPAEGPRDRAGDGIAAAPRGLLVVYTGDGKGKTTAALGLVFRALGRELPVAVVQFVKGRWRTGERLFAEGLAGLDFLTLGEGFTWVGEEPERHAAAARAAWERARELLAAGRHRVVVLDELTHVIVGGYVSCEEVLDGLAARPAGTTVVVTGRGAPQPLLAVADLVTEMRAVKHPFERGVKAMAGIDF